MYRQFNNILPFLTVLMVSPIVIALNENVCEELAKNDHKFGSGFQYLENGETFYSLAIKNMSWNLIMNSPQIGLEVKAKPLLRFWDEVIEPKTNISQYQRILSFDEPLENKTFLVFHKIGLKEVYVVDYMLDRITPNLGLANSISPPNFEPDFVFRPLKSEPEEWKTVFVVQQNEVNAHLDRSSVKTLQLERHRNGNYYFNDKSIEWEPKIPQILKNIDKNVNITAVFPNQNQDNYIVVVRDQISPKYCITPSLKASEPACFPRTEMKPLIDCSIDSGIQTTIPTTSSTTGPIKESESNNTGIKFPDDPEPLSTKAEPKKYPEWLIFALLLVIIFSILTVIIVAIVAFIISKRNKASNVENIKKHIELKRIKDRIEVRAEESQNKSID